LDEEIRYIWNIGAGLTLNKALFGTIRYFTTAEFGFVDIVAAEFAWFLAHVTVGFIAYVCYRSMHI